MRNEKKVREVILSLLASNFDFDIISFNVGDEEDILSDPVDWALSRRVRIVETVIVPKTNLYGVAVDTITTSFINIGCKSGARVSNLRLLRPSRLRVYRLNQFGSRKELIMLIGVPIGLSDDCSSDEMEVYKMYENMFFAGDINEEESLTRFYEGFVKLGSESALSVDIACKFKDIIDLIENGFIDNEKAELLIKELVIWGGAVVGFYESENLESILYKKEYNNNGFIHEEIYKLSSELAENNSKESEYYMFSLYVNGQLIHRSFWLTPFLIGKIIQSKANKINSLRDMSLQVNSLNEVTLNATVRFMNREINFPIDVYVYASYPPSSVANICDLYELEVKSFKEFYYKEFMIIFPFGTISKINAQFACWLDEILSKYTQ